MRSISLVNGGQTLVDDEDFDRVTAAGRWSAKRRARNTHVRRSVRVAGRVRTVYLHHFITGLTYVDHINGDGLDNRRGNLRAATHGQNMLNLASRGGRSPFKGVTWDHSTKTWMARISREGVRHYLGLFTSEQAAAAAYDAAARELHGDFARLNLPPTVQEDAA